VGGLFFGFGGAERSGRNQELRFGGIDGLEFESEVVAIAVVAVGESIDASAEVIDFAGFGGEGESGAELGAAADAGLPVRADLMIAGIDGEEKVGLAAVGTDPDGVETDFGGDSADFETEVVGFQDRNDVHHRFAGFGMRNGMLLVVGLDVEINLGGAAAGSGASSGSLILREDGRNEKKSGKKECEHGLGHDGLRLRKTISKLRFDTRVHTSAKRWL